MQVKYLVLKVEQGEVVVDSLFPSEEDALWKIRYLQGEEGSRRGEVSLGDYKVVEVVEHGN